MAGLRTRWYSVEEPTPSTFPQCGGVEPAGSPFGAGPCPELLHFITALNQVGCIAIYFAGDDTVAMPQNATEIRVQSAVSPAAHA